LGAFAPKTFTTGKYVGILVALQWYWIADALSMQIQRHCWRAAEADSQIAAIEALAETVASQRREPL